MADFLVCLLEITVASTLWIELPDIGVTHACRVIQERTEIGITLRAKPARDTFLADQCVRAVRMFDDTALLVPAPFFPIARRAPLFADGFGLVARDDVVRDVDVDSFTTPCHSCFVDSAVDVRACTATAQSRIPEQTPRTVPAPPHLPAVAEIDFRVVAIRKLRIRDIANVVRIFHPPL